MDKAKAPEVKDSVPKLYSNPNSEAKYYSLSFQASVLAIKKRKPPSLVSLCLGVIGRHFEDIIEDLTEIAANFPSNMKMALVAIARRRRLLNDNVIVALADSSWEILDLSDSEVSDFGLLQVVGTCKHLQAVDISRCSKLTSAGVSELLQKCQSLEILRWGGCPRSENTARRCFALLKPTLEHVEGESWEELDTSEIAHGATSLRWLLWPKIEKDQLESLSDECPRIIVNPKPSPLGYRGLDVPREARLNVSLDDPIVEDIDPKTWAVCGFVPRTSPSSVSSTEELPVAEKFRLAFLERDNRLAPKRAKNARQHQRRAEKEWVMMNSRAKALALASLASKSLNIRN
ncbi:uncharacterized protein LOC107774561 isoform X1 [Nicotiana tabacum]|uniref:Uncharacterized protein LOC107774561 isoform X1 n=1 Tax=Nicotiana tabacum TaxID=4097 RepID=A0A1S3YBL8_TOBAC|nr:uncharacterized protein LOC104094163 [Nicotiana tomentosiformis]XP_016449605.1 PREDICTED: uncharacterized protein LOC107774561 [Nicotiana tabacum]